uniref:Uncharacterized protein n=1 Tax=Anguilla anguilla TaxID=7936 RepID=A0A0E9RMK7_ANGAN
MHCTRLPLGYTKMFCCW